jgi:hypothetical protein
MSLTGRAMIPVITLGLEMMLPEKMTAALDEKNVDVNITVKGFEEQSIYYFREVEPWKTIRT